MPIREIEVTGPIIRNGRIYFPSSDRIFFPKDSFGDRKGDGHKGKPVVIRAGGREVETDIRLSSELRISPRKSFDYFLRQVRAKEGGRLRFTRTSDREYVLDYLP